MKDRFSTSKLLSYLLGLLYALLGLHVILAIVGNLWLMLVGDWLPIDEMVFADIGRMIAQGYPMYSRMWDIKPPVTHYLLAGFIALLGNTVLTIKIADFVLGAWLVLVTLGLTAQLTRSRPAILFAGGLIALYSSWIIRIEGFNPVVVMTAFSMSAALIAVLARGRRGWLLLSGVLLALSFFSKSVMVLEAFPVLAFAALFAPTQKGRAAGWVILGGLLGVGGIVLWAGAAGVLESMWHSAFYNSFLYAFEPQGQQGQFNPAFITQYFIGQSLPFLAPLLLLALPTFLGRYTLPQRTHYWVILGWCAAAFVGAFIGRALRRTYFVEVVPPLVVLIACAMAYHTWSRRSMVIASSGFALVLLSSIFIPDSALLTHPLLTQAWRSPDDIPAVQAARPTADFLAQHLRPDECIWQWDSFGLITYLADRLPCQSVFATQPLMVKESFDYTRHRAEYMQEIIAAKPTLHSRELTWWYFPEAERLFTRYGREQVFSGVVDIFAVDWSAWHTTYANFGDFALIGYDLYTPTPICAGATLETAFTWQVEQPVERPYQLFLQLLTPDWQTKISGIDTAPHSQTPILEWDIPHMIYLGDRLQLPIPSNTAAGKYVLITGFYDAETLANLPPSAADGQPMAGGFVQLTSLEVQSCAN